jgi:hypothetical protein
MAARSRRTWALGLAAAGLLALAVLLVYWRLLLTNLVLATGDAFTYFTPYRDYADAVLRSGRLPLWNPYLFLGVPFLANPQAAVLYPLHWPFIWLPAGKSLAASLGLHLVLGGLGAYLLAHRGAGLGFLPALATGLIFGLSGYLGAHAGQVNQVSAAAWLPWLLVLLEEAAGTYRPPTSGKTPRPPGFRPCLRTANLLALAGLALVVALQLLAGHTQTSYINLAGLLLVACYPALAALLAWAGSRLRRQPRALERQQLAEAVARLALALAAIALAALVASVQLVPTWELAEQSVRSGGLSYREVVSFSLRPRSLLFTLLPTYGENLAGRLGTPAFAEFVAYVGVAALVLAFLALARARRAGSARSNPYLGIGLLLALAGFLLALGVYNPLTFLLYQLVPGFDLFRAPARWMALYTLGVSLLAGIGLHSLAGAGGPLGPRPVFLWHGIRRPARLIWLGLLALLCIAFLLWQQWPGPLTVALWLAAGGVVLLLAYWRGRQWAAPAIVALLVLELAAASLALDHTRPTAPEAITSLRTAPAHLLAVAADEEAAGRIPGRFLSLSGITYDPGDLAEIEQVFAGQLPPAAIYDLVVASKLQEIVAPNLPLLWRLPAVDGYDGGVLPLQRYVDMQSLFVPPERLEPDGRLREQLKEVPSSRLLRLLGVEHVITDKVFDVWQDGVYYDLQLSSRLGPGAEVVVDSAGRLEATTIGLFTHVEGAAGLAAGTPVAEVLVAQPGGRPLRFELLAGEHTAEGLWTAAAAHGQPARRQPWPGEDAGWDYLSQLPLPAPASPEQIVVRSLLPAGMLVLRATTLIDERTGTHAALTVPADGAWRRVHSGDVKVYQEQAVLPRALTVGKARVVADEPAALAALADPGFDPAAEVVLLAEDLAGHGLAATAAGAADVAGAEVQVAAYTPERVVLRTELPASGYLVLGDTWYEGWQATVDGVAAPVLRANLLFRAVALPAGSHEVVFEFAPRSLALGAAASAVGLALVGGLAVAGWIRGRATRRVRSA